MQLRILACEKLQSVAAALVDELRRVPDSVALPIVEQLQDQMPSLLLTLIVQAREHEELPPRVLVDSTFIQELVPLIGIELKRRPFRKILLIVILIRNRTSLIIVDNDLSALTVTITTTTCTPPRRFFLRILNHGSIIVMPVFVSVHLVVFPNLFGHRADAFGKLVFKEILDIFEVIDFGPT